ncbi:MAG: DUF4157 domain-containing protein [Reyranellaceae bacterium]
MQTHAVKVSGQADVTGKRTGARRSIRTTAHDGLAIGSLPLGASLADIPILPGDSAGSSSALHRHAAGPGPSAVPASVREVLRRPGQPLPAGLRGEMETRLGCDFSDVRLHTDEDAGKSAAAVAAQAYTVGRHIVFGAGHFDPGSRAGHRLLTHELAHAASLPRGTALPAGELRISTPGEATERHAVAVAEGVLTPPAMTTIAPPALYRQPAQPAPPVALNGVSVNHDRVSVPPPAGHGLKAILDPPNATGVTLAVSGGTATIAAGTTINSTTGKVTIDAKQTGGSADVKATQVTPAATITATAPFNFTAMPGKITATKASALGTAGFYGGSFMHTFAPPKGSSPSALELAHVNEKFAAGSGDKLTITGTLGTFIITINEPDLPDKGWDLDSSGTMGATDNLSWDQPTADARPFVANASNKTPANTLPQALTVTQSLRNLNFPAQTYGATVATTTHRRAIVDRGGKLKAVTSANATGINEEVVEAYAGPTVFRNAKATPASVPATATAPPGGAAPAATTSTISVDSEGDMPTPTFSINAPDLGCTIDSTTGVLTPGTNKGTVTVQGGDGTNFDEAKVTIT